MSGRKGSKIDRILEAIPDDGWVRASDIEEKTGIRKRSVSGIISEHLLHDFIERRPVRVTGANCYEYRYLRKMRARKRSKEKD